MAVKTMGKASKKPEKKETVSYLCPYCNKEKREDKFYMSSDPLILTGRTVMCIECAEKIARQYDPYSKTYGECTRESIMEALERLDKPFKSQVWDTSYMEVYNPTQKKNINMWSSYIKNISVKQYITLRWRDGDIYSVRQSRSGKGSYSSEDKITEQTKEILEELDTNRRDVIRMVGYDPFINYQVEEDKPVLYAQLISFIDEETKNDGMKMNAVIQIVQAFNQIQKINDAINELTTDVQKLTVNNGTVKQLADTTTKLLSGANALAKDNGIRN